MDMDEKDNKEIKDVSYKTIKDGTIFNNPHSFFVFKKAEKVVTALYLVTEFLSAKEPIKWSIRDSASSLIQKMTVVTRRNPNDQATELRSVNRTLLEISSYLQISKAGGLISVMNSEILDNEVRNLSGQIEEAVKGQKGLEDRSLTDNLFKPVVQKDIPKGHTGQEDKGQSLFEKMARGHDINKDIKDIKNSSNNNHETIEIIGSPNRGSKNRIDKVISVIKKNNQVTIKDISREVDGISEKTIQRDLIKLIKDGLIKKEGERRWSKYSMA